MRYALVLVAALIGGCAADGLPEVTPAVPAVEGAADMARPSDMLRTVDMVQSAQQTGDMTDSPEPMPPPLDCGYAVGGPCCNNGTCAGELTCGTDGICH